MESIARAADGGSRRRLRKRDLARAGAAIGVIGASILLNGWSHSGMTLYTGNYSVESLPVDRWGFSYRHIPAAIPPGTWPAGVVAPCGDAFWSYDRWRVGLILVQRCNR